MPSPIVSFRQPLVDPRRALWPLLLATTILFASGWQTSPETPFDPWFGMDKCVHFAVFGLLANLILRSLRLSSTSRALIVACLLASLFGAVDELRQAFNPVRDFSIFDLMADALGASLAVTLYGYWPAYRNLLERDVFPGHGTWRTNGTNFSRDSETPVSETPKPRNPGLHRS